ncbi:serine hydrolase domain-containing protein [Bosea psychrotolerans]|uniref:CubicO group peptidase (Beta-lactamase class C family) n=1 Tax=Bosea psychrotolerans TaxID=1871628 RepID=A0A2S4M7S2_9HYPH|nr:serine hydrolase [Bosea psychrotolerans]POR50772.1 CubicO group peptidase (beta-lactamase class C family) [Bosea psychrotolerans]
MRSSLFAIVFVVIVVLAAHVRAEPAGPWQNADPASSGWSAEGLKAARTEFERLGPTALMIVRDGRAIANWGDTGRKVNMRSVRKSILSTLYGVAVAEGRINLASTLAHLRIDDKAPGLTDAEKQATIRDLLMARSGIYHLAAYETAEMREKRPERGSHAPGSFWFYNNWDFNALGTIYRQETGEDIFQSFDSRIAKPIGMQDFQHHDGSYVLEGASIHPAYPFSLSARDAARFGLLILDRGRWQGRQLVPSAWIEEATRTYSRTDRSGRGYGYLWWTLSPEEWGAGAVIASGFGGQIIAIIPSKRLVVVQTVDLRQKSRGLRSSKFLALLRLIANAAP